MFLSGSFKEFFAVFPVMRSQCSQPVKPKMSQTGVPEVTRNGMFGMYPSGRPQCTTFGKNRANLGNTARKCLSEPTSGQLRMSVSQSWVYCRERGHVRMPTIRTFGCTATTQPTQWGCVLDVVGPGRGKRDTGNGCASSGIERR